jgi:hypothetical protein
MSQVKSLVEGSSIVFLGTVRPETRLRRESSMGTRAGLVRIETVLEAPAVLGNLRGVEVTVLWRDHALKPGAKDIFFTNAASYGERITLAEVGRAPSKQQKAVEAAIEERRQGPLRTRVTEAELIVIGAVEEVELPEGPGPEFDDPLFGKAYVRAESSIKGSVPGEWVEVLFASSKDVRWYASPKLRPGQEGIFLLRRGESKKAPPDALTVLGPLDVQPRSAKSQFERWLASEH